VARRERGFIALTSVLIIGAVVLILIISLFHSALTDYSISTVFEGGQQADVLADFCLKEGVLKLQEDINYLGGEEIEFNGAACSIDVVDTIDDITKEVSSLGRSGDPPHFSRASQRIRYIIEPGQEGWVLWGEEGEDWENIDVAGNSLKLTEADPILIEEDFSEYYEDHFQNLEITGDGSLVLTAAGYACSDGVDNDGDGLIDYPEDPGCSNSEDDDEYNELELGEDGAPCNDGSECQSGYCYNNICCDSDETCCSLDSQCPTDECNGNCQKTDHYCDTVTDHYCKSRVLPCNCVGSCKCYGGVCTGPWDYGEEKINDSWDLNCDDRITKRWNRVETCILNCVDGWFESVPDCGVSGTYCSCKPFGGMMSLIAAGECIPYPCSEKTQQCK